MIKVAICDDNEIEKKKTESLTEKILSKNKINYKISVFSDSKNLWYEYEEGSNFDILLLDIEMPNVNGIELTRIIKEKNPNALVIFITSYEKYVLESFKVQPYRFIPKDKLTEMLPEAINDAIKYINKQEGKFYFAKNQQGVCKVKINEIVYICHSGKYAHIKLSNNESIKVRETLKDIYKDLPEEDFIWIERGCICNVAHIEKVYDKTVLFTNGDLMQVSRDKLKETKEKLCMFIMERD